jgi:HEAT repeat protein
MDKLTRSHLDHIQSKDKELQNKAYFYILNVTEKPVDWAYDVWDEMLASLTHKDNHVRAIAAQVLCNLAKSDPSERILKDFNSLLDVTKDDRFVTARHCMQALWKVGVVGKKQQKAYMEGLERRYKECITESNSTLIRYDILQSMRNVYDRVKDEKIRKKALELIALEDDLKYRAKYASLWKAK